MCGNILQILHNTKQITNTMLPIQMRLRCSIWVVVMSRGLAWIWQQFPTDVQIAMRACCFAMNKGMGMNRDVMCCDASGDGPIRQLHGGDGQRLRRVSPRGQGASLISKFPYKGFGIINFWIISSVYDMT